MVNVAAYKSEAEGDSRLSTGNWELLSAVSVMGKVNKSRDTVCTCVSKILCDYIICYMLCIRLEKYTPNVFCLGLEERADAPRCGINFTSKRSAFTVLAEKRFPHCSGF